MIFQGTISLLSWYTSSKANTSELFCTIPDRISSPDTMNLQHSCRLHDCLFRSRGHMYDVTQRVQGSGELQICYEQINLLAKVQMPLRYPALEVVADQLRRRTSL